MADQNPMGDGDAVVLQLPSEHRRVLRQIFEAGAFGAAEDLDRSRGRLPDPARRERELGIFRQLIGALQGDPIDHDAEMSRMLAETAESFDRTNEYRRVTQEHDALHSVVAQLEPKEGGDG